MTDAEARAYVDQVLGDRSPNERQFVRAVCRFETSYSKGWPALAKKLGSTDPQAFANVNNWGAITAPDPAKGAGVLAFYMRDRWWRMYETSEAGLLDAARTILKPNVQGALAKGDGSLAVRAMADNGYYIEPNGIAKSQQERFYRSAVARNYDDMIRATKEEKLLTFGAATGASLLDAVTGALFVGGLLALIYTFSSDKDGPA